MTAPREFIEKQTLNSTGPSQTFSIRAGMKFSASVTGDGVMEGQAADDSWVALPDSGPLFGGWAPASGKIRVNVTTAPVSVHLVQVIENNA